MTSLFLLDEEVGNLVQIRQVRRVFFASTDGWLIWKEVLAANILILQLQIDINREKNIIIGHY